MMDLLSQDEVKALFDYRDGHLYWKEKQKKHKQYEQADRTIKNRSLIYFRRNQYQASRLIFLYHHGFLPFEIEHVNRNELDNRIENLRDKFSSQEITQEKVKELFNYIDGHLVRKHNNSGPVAGWIDDSGYIRMSVTGKYYREHRVIFLYHHGRFPTYIDHINRIKTDNRIENLRECTRSENCANSKKYDTKGSKWKGIYPVRNKWRAIITKESKRYHLGYFNTEKDAAIAYNIAAQGLFGTFANINEI